MASPSWITKILDDAGLRYLKRQHPSARTAAEVARFEHTSGVRFGKVVVVIADKHAVLLVMPSYAHVDEDRARFLLRAKELRLARARDIDERLPGAPAGTTPPLRHWPHVDIWMDPLLEHEGPFVFQAGTHEDAIEVDFKDWKRLVHPKVGVFVQPTYIGV